MSIRRHDGGVADVSTKQLDVLSAVEAEYLARYPKHQKRLAIVHLRRGHSWPYSRIALAIDVSTGHACRVHHATESRLAQIGKEIFSTVALFAADESSR